MADLRQWAPPRQIIHPVEASPYMRGLPIPPVSAAGCSRICQPEQWAIEWDEGAVAVPDSPGGGVVGRGGPGAGDPVAAAGRYVDGAQARMLPRRPGRHPVGVRDVKAPLWHAACTVWRRQRP